MKRKLQKHFHRYMIRPIIYQTSTRLLVGFTASLLWRHFGQPSANQRMILSFPFVATGAVYAVLAWMAYLRLDGIRMPVFDRKLFQHKKKPQILSFGDMSDHVDDEIISFEDLEPEEKDTCLLISNLFCALLFIGVSFLVK